MPETKDPAKLTKEQLKRELKKHGVKLPDAQALKAEYVNLYKKKILKKKIISGFSSEEDDEPVARITRSAKTMASGVLNVEVSNEKSTIEIEKTIPAVDGAQDYIGVRKSPRKIKKPLRYIEESEEGSDDDDESDQDTNEEQQKEPLPSEVRVKVERIDYTTIRTMTSNGIMVSELSNEQLRDELEARGSNIGPIVGTTRKLYERKLEKLLKNAGMGDAATGNGTQEYSDQESDEEEEEEVEVEEPTPIQTRNRRSLLRSAEKDGSATRRRAMRTRAEVRKQEEEEEEDVDEAPTPSSGEKIVPARSERQWVPVWVAILIVIAIVAFLYFVISTMEENPVKPFLL